MLSRFKAFLWHFSSSALVALLAMLLVFQLWYPAPLHEAAGVTHIFLMVLLVDVALGPLLTMVVYKKGKKSLPFDLSVVVLLQVSALGYGLWTVAEGRPAWLVFNTDRFDVVRVADIDSRKLSEASDEFRKPSWLGPGWAVAIEPDSMAERNQVLFESVSGGSDISQRPNLYRSLDSQIDLIKKRLHAFDELKRYNNSKQVDSVLRQWPEADSWLPLMASSRSMVVLFSGRKGLVVAVSDLRPWAD